MSNSLKIWVGATKNRDLAHRPQPGAERVSGWDIQGPFSGPENAIGRQPMIRLTKLFTSVGHAGKLYLLG